MNAANNTYVTLLNDILFKGENVVPRNKVTFELRQHTTCVKMLRPIITIPARKLDYRFMAAEASWILSGDRALDAHVRKNLGKYSDDGRTMRGAYGPPFLQQIEYCRDAIVADRDTRQACMTIWERNPRPSRDIPCTIGLQFLLRTTELHTNVWMRSSDAWLGYPYDIFTFSMMTWHLSLMLKPVPTLGVLSLTAGSQHIYDKNLDDAMNLTCDGNNLDLCQHKFNTPDDLLNALYCDRNESDPTKWSIL